MKERILMIVFVLILGSAWTVALVGVDRATRDAIEAYETGKVRKSVLTALGIAFEEEDIDAVFKENITAEEI